MCIIVVKQTNTITAQHWTWLQNCFDNNNDGAGMMWQHGERVVVSKGYMEWQEFKDAVVKHRLAKVNPVVFHFRWATHGAISPGNCHPFPISRKVRDLQALDCRCDMAVVHNGVLDVAIPKDSKLSDTQVFVRDILTVAPHDMLQRPAYQLLLETTGSKFVFMSPHTTWKVGEFVGDGDWLFSNSGYKQLAPKATGWQAMMCGLCGEHYGNLWCEDWGCRLCKDCANIYGRQTTPITPTVYKPYYSTAQEVHDALDSDDEMHEAWLKEL